MEEQKVYVVYKDGQPYVDRGKKIAYLQERYARQLITTIVNKKYEHQYEFEEDHNKRWFNLTSAEKLELTQELRKQFEIKIFIEDKSKSEQIKEIYLRVKDITGIEPIIIGDRNTVKQIKGE